MGWLFQYEIEGGALIKRAFKYRRNFRRLQASTSLCAHPSCCVYCFSQTMLNKTLILLSAANSLNYKKAKISITFKCQIC